MAFVNPQVLAQIFGQEGAINQASPNQQQAMISMLAGAGSGMTQAASQPGANFGQALGGGAAGMMQGRQQAMQQQAMQQQIQMQKDKMRREEARLKGFMDLVMGKQDFASQVAAQPAQVPQLPQQPPGPQVAPATPPPQVGVEPLPGTPVGILAERQESSGQGVGTVSSGQMGEGRADPGGVSYGRHQISSSSMPAFLQSPEGQPFATQFGDLEPGSENFNKIYGEVVAGAGPQFKAAQKAYIDRTHFQPNLERAARVGLPVDNRGVQEALYSMGVQHSGAGNTQILNDAMARLPQNASPEQVIDALYEARGNYADQFVSKSAGSGRYERERRQALQLARGGAGGQSGAPDTQRAQVAAGGAPVAAQAAPAAPQASPAAQNGYQQGAAPGMNLTPQQRQILLGLGPEAGMQVLAENAFQTPGEQPAAVREALFASGGDVPKAQEILLNKMTGTERADFEKRIDAVQAANPGATRSQATNFVLGVTGMDVSPQTGRVTRTNELGGTATEVPVQAQGALPSIEVSGPTAWDLAQNANPTGVTSGLAELSNRTLGQLGLSVGEDTVTVRRYLGQLENDIVRAFQESPRFAEGERQQLLQELQIGPSIAQDESTLKASLQASASSLNTRLNRYARAADNPRLGETTRREAAEKADLIQWALARIGAPAGGGEAGGEQTAQPPSGVDPSVAEVWEYMTPEERALWQN